MGFYNKLLKPTEFKRSKRKLYGFDVETCDNNKHVYLISLWGEDWHGTFRTIPDFLEALKNRRFRNSWIIASNLHFDLLAVIWEHHDLKKVFRWQTRGNTSDVMYAKTFVVDGQFQSHRNRAQKGHTDHCLCFVDTWNYDRCSVEKMGELLGLPKLPKPACVPENRLPRDDEWKEVEAYNLRDAEVSCKYMQFLIEGFESLSATVKYTLAGTAMSLFRNKYLEGQYWRHDENILLEQMMGYYGGRTEAFERGNIKTYLLNTGMPKMNYYDFNSLYPSVMRGHRYPNPNTLRTSHLNSLDRIRDAEGMSCVSITCPTDMRYPLLPYRRDDGLIMFPVGSWTAWYCHVELRRALELGYKIRKVHKTYWYRETCQPFDQYVDDLYRLRKEFKKAGDRREKTVKLLLNSLYGKFGQRFINREEIAHSDAVSLEELSKHKNVETLPGGYLRFSGITTEPAAFCIPIWAAYITAYARLKLHNAMLLYQPVYCDTDSVLTTAEVPASSELGDLKLEYEIFDGVIVRSKFYGFIGREGAKDVQQVKIKGMGVRLGYEAYMQLVRMSSTVSNDVKKRICECDPDGLQTLSEKVKMCVICGRTKYSKFTKFKEALRRGLTPNEIISVTKGFGLEDQKHVWPANFSIDGWQTSTPVIIDDQSLVMPMPLKWQQKDVSHGQSQSSPRYANQHPAATTSASGDRSGPGTRSP